MVNPMYQDLVQNVPETRCCENERNERDFTSRDDNNFYGKFAQKSLTVITIIDLIIYEDTVKKKKKRIKKKKKQTMIDQ